MNKILEVENATTISKKCTVHDTADSSRCSSDTALQLKVSGCLLVDSIQAATIPFWPRCKTENTAQA
ncbi:MAG: hypothetical protein LBF70_02555 [Holosporales bacterium]|nr:hypothetical protein [Holosporales bacterium]